MAEKGKGKRLLLIEQDGTTYRVIAEVIRGRWVVVAHG